MPRATAKPKSRRRSRTSTNSGSGARRAKPKKLEPFTAPHFREYASRLVFDDEEQHPLEDWQYAIAEDIFGGAIETWILIPEGNSKSTFLAQLALYGADYSREPWIPIGAAASEQAMIVYTQAAGFVNRTEGMDERFKCFSGYKLIRSKRNGGVGIKVYAWDPKTGDGVIPYPFALLDELHRHPDMRLYSLWKGKRKKRGAQVIASSTAGEPNSPFENTRRRIRDKATKRRRDGAYLRAQGGGLVLHEWMVQQDADCADMEKVKEANPLSALDVEGFAEDFESPTLDLGDWKRLKCNRPTRSSKSAISDREWDESEVDDEIPEGEDIDLGLDIGWKHDTTAFVPLWKAPKYRLLGPSKILVPPRDGSSLHPNDIKDGFIEIADRNPVLTLVMDTSRAEDIAAWMDEQGIEVIDRQQTNPFAVEDYEAFMDGLRNGTLKHVQDAGLRAHAMNAIARRLPGGDYRFDRPVESRRSAREQDRRVIDALVAAAMVVEYSSRDIAPKESVYNRRGLITV